MPSTTRTFVAIAVPDKLGEKLTRLQSLLAPEVPDVRWSVITPFHVTLAFLGDVAHTDLNAVCRAVADASADFGPLPLRLEGLGVFPNPTRARVFWVGVTGAGLAALEEFQRRLLVSVRSAGYPADEERFQPHVTLGRLKTGRGAPKGPGRDVSPLLKHYRTWAAGGFTANEVVTYASTLTPDGPVYAPLAKAPLAGRKRSPNA